mgnify:CR=1 FL=1
MIRQGFITRDEGIEIAEKFDANHNIIYLENYLSEMPNAIYQIKKPF